MAKIYITILSFFILSFVKGQGVNEPINAGVMYNVVIEKAGYDNAPTLIFAPGLGEVGEDSSGLLVNGPLWALKNGWNGYVRGVKWNIVGIQPPGQSISISHVNRIIDTLKNRYNIDTCRTYLTGLSFGAMCLINDALSTKSGSRIWFSPASVFMSAHTIPALDSIQQLKYPLFGGHFFGLIGNSDSTGRPMTMNAYRYMNSIVPGSAKVYVYSGGHSGWNNYYDTTFRSYGDGQNIYEWLDMFSKRPYASASQTTITTSNSSITLNGIVNRFENGKDGVNNSITWTKVSGGSATITAPNSETTTVTGLSEGSYVFRLTSANAAGGLSATQDVTVNITASEEKGIFIKKRGRKLIIKP